MNPRQQLTLGYVLIGLGVAAWIPYVVLLLTGAEISFLPFLGLHLAGVLSGAWFRSRATRSLAVGKPHRRKSLVGRILIYLGILAWVPYFALQRAGGAEISMAPFLTAHLIGVLGGGALLVSSYFPSTEGREGEQDPPSQKRD